MMNLTEEQRKKAMTAQSPAELLALAKVEQFPLTEAEAEQYFASLHPPVGKINDEELDNVVGGGCYNRAMCPKCGSTNTGRSWASDNKLMCHDCNYVIDKLFI